MKNQIRQIFHSPKFTVGFIIFAALLVLTVFYPLIVTNDPLEMVGQGNFFKPGTYISVSEAVNTNPYTLNLNASSGRLEQNLSMEERMAMADWLNQFAGLSSKDIDVTDAGGLVSLWKDHYDSASEQKGLIAARKKYFSRLDKKITGLLEDRDVLLAEKNQETGEVSVKKTIPSTSYVNVKDVGSRRVFILGTDNFGRDVLTELVAAIKTSLKIGFIAGLIATTIGLSLGLIAGYLGGIIDDFILFITNLFTVIPSFILLILISYSIGKNARGVMMVAIIIGLTSWTWTTRSVRSQVISLRNRDHVNLSKLSGHSLFRIILTDILPYIASYVVMALILQISSGILAEAQLSMIGLGPATTTVSTLGLMMNWAMSYSAHLNGDWWAYFPVIISIALISFSLNLMNTGLDQIFNPQLRE
ncbi:MAG: ABC transporter permease [Paenibacillaceae bacterium]|jgi:ABC-type dipeptide/oligopeptide/nickel transport system permease subunit|nr:ABC transporter permease [Paenibacillaceae bacterium]